jgi:hypothetical protein
MVISLGYMVLNTSSPEACSRKGREIKTSSPED